MIHHQNSVKLIKTAAGKKSVCTILTYYQHTIILCFFNGRYNDRFLLGTYQTFIIRMRVQSRHTYPWFINTKDYKLPKGITFDYGDGSKKKQTPDKMKDKKGKVEISYSGYTINKGVSDSVFK